MLGLLLRVRLLSLFQSTLGGGKKRRTLPIILLMGALLLFAVVYFFAVLTLLFSLIVVPLAAADAMPVYFGVGGIFCLLLMLCGSVIFTKNQLYAADDNEMLLAMPVPPRTILLSRLVFLLLINLLLEAVVAAPMLVAYLAFAPVRPATLAATLSTLLALPFLSLAIAALLGYILARIEAKIKRKSVLTLLLTLIFLGAYFFLVFGMEEYMLMLEADITPLIDLVSSVAPITWLGQAMTGSFLPLFLLLLLSAGAFLGVLAWLSHTFIKVTMDKGATVRTVYREKHTGARRPITAIILRELQLLASSSGYMVNTGLGLLFLLALPVYLLIDPSLLRELGAVQPLDVLLPSYVTTGLLLCSSTATFSCHTVSLEGRSLWIVRTSPVPTRTVLRGKVAYHLLLTLPVALVSGILTSLALGKGLAVSLSLILLLLAHNLFLAVFGLFCNLLLPKLEWSNMMIPVKQGGSAALTLLAGMFLSLLFGGCGILLSLLLPPAIALALASLLPLGGAALLFLYLIRGGVRRFESL